MKFKTILLTLFFLACGGDADISNLNGDTCTVDIDCASGLCLTELGENSAYPITFIDGYCSNECDYDDSGVASGCADNEICLIYDANYSDNIPEMAYCFTTGCQSDWDCRDENYVCKNFGYTDAFILGACIPIAAQ